MLQNRIVSRLLEQVLFHKGKILLVIPLFVVIKFVCDEMLGTLAKWLRILGYDTLYGGNNDEDLLQITQEEKRILLTRDKALYQRIKIPNLGIYINTVNLKEQISLVLQKTGVFLDEQKIFTRCILCNVPVVKKDKKEVQGSIPPFAFQNNKEFWECSQCHRIYWKGSHWDSIKKKIREIEKGENMQGKSSS